MSSLPTVRPKPALQQLRDLRENCKLISVVVIYLLENTNRRKFNELKISQRITIPA
jgi:hypothetical protein